MAFTDEEIIKATELALRQYTVVTNNVYTNPYEYTPEPYSPPADWPLLNDCPSNGIQMIFCDINPSILKFKPTISSGVYHVDWGDGTSYNYAYTETAIHTYSEGTGTPSSLGYTTFKCEVTSEEPITGIYLDGDVEGTKQWAVNILGLVLNTPHLNTLGLTLSDLSLVQFINILDSSTNLTNIDNAINSCNQLVYVDLSGLKSSITSAKYLFNSCTSLDYVDISNLTGLTNALGMFSYCYSLRSIKLPQNSAITDANAMFRNCYNLRYIDGLRMPNVIDSNNMFDNCQSLIYFDMSNWLNIEIVYNMFDSCYSLREVKLPSVQVPVNDISYMFYYTYALKEIDLSCFDLVTDAASAFRNSGIQEIDISHMTLLSNAYNMFYLCSQLRNVVLGTISAITDAGGMFSNTKIIKSDISNLTALTTANNMFISCTELIECIVGNKPVLTEASSMFSTCRRLKSIDVSGCNNVINALSMFNWCEDLTQITANNFGKDASKTNCKYIFNYCHSLEDIYMPDTKFSIFTCRGSSGSVYIPLDTWNFNNSSPFDAESVSILIQYTQLTDTEINQIFSDLPTVSGRTIDVRYNTGSSSCNPSIATAKGWTVLR